MIKKSHNKYKTFIFQNKIHDILLFLALYKTFMY